MYIYIFKRVHSQSFQKIWVEGKKIIWLHFLFSPVCSFNSSPVFNRTHCSHGTFLFFNLNYFFFFFKSSLKGSSCTRVCVCVRETQETNLSKLVWDEQPFPQRRREERNISGVWEVRCGRGGWGGRGCCLDWKRQPKTNKQTKTNQKCLNACPYQTPGGIHTSLTLAAVMAVAGTLQKMRCAALHTVPRQEWNPTKTHGR